MSDYINLEAEAISEIAEPSSENSPATAKNVESATGKEEDSIIVKQLRLALAEERVLKDRALQRQATLKLQNKVLKIAAGIIKEPCRFLQKIPVELREQVYKHLLVDSILSTPACINRNNAHHHVNTVKFGLHPNILRVNRQIYDEASKVLYGDNTFRVECISRATNPYYPMSAINRYFDPSGSHEKYRSLGEVSVVKKVKHWKVLISAYRGTSLHAPSPDFVDFCRAIADTKPISLEVMVIGRGLEKQDSRGFSYDDNVDSYHPLVKVTKPLKLLTNVGYFTMIDAANSELPPPPVTTSMMSYFNPPKWNDRIDAPDANWFNYPELISNLKLIVEGNTPTELAFKMHGKLLKYAQAFERHEEFQKDMDLLFGVAGQTVRHRDAMILLRSQHEEWLEHTDDNLENSSRNPYKLMPYYHPMEDALERATKASDYQNVASFKKWRKRVLDELEDSYQRIALASTTVNTHLKTLKPQCSLFSTLPVLRQYGKRLTDLTTPILYYLEIYAASFTRPVNGLIALNIRSQAHRFKLIYSIRNREVLLQKLNDMHQQFITRDNSKVKPLLREFIAMVKSVVLDMDAQWLTIREARKNLFIYDLTDKGCDIDEEFWRCDEFIDWSVDEPDMNVPRNPAPAHQHATNQTMWLPVPPMNVAGPVAGGQGPVGVGGVMAITGAGNTQQAAFANAMNGLLAAMAPAAAPFMTPMPPLPAPVPAPAPQAQAPQQGPLFMGFTPGVGLTGVANTAAGAVAALGTATMVAATAALVPAAGPVAAPNPPPANAFVAGPAATIAGHAFAQQIDDDSDDEDEYEDYDNDGSAGDWNSERDSDAELEDFS